MMLLTFISLIQKNITNVQRLNLIVSTKENLENRKEKHDTPSQNIDSPTIEVQSATDTLSESEENRNYEECLACQ